LSRPTGLRPRRQGSPKVGTDSATRSGIMHTDTRSEGRCDRSGRSVFGDGRQAA
jgi:hypothetical protein